jgi:transposase
VRKLQAEIRRLLDENQSLRRDKAELETQVATLQKRIDELQAALGQAERQAKRQAAPFSKGPPKASPQKRGRKPGTGYGRKAHRPPPPAQIDEVIDVPLPDQCPRCGGAVEEQHVATQYQVEIPQRPICRQFQVHLGKCTACGRPVHGQHPRQTSAALGAAASQLGPNAQAAVAFLNKHCGMSYGKIVQTFRVLFGITLSAGGAAQIVHRVARRCQPVYEQIRVSVRRSPWVAVDETGWKVGGRKAWLHVLVGDRATCFDIARHRDATVAAAILGADYAGTLIHDGWSPYEQFRRAHHQQCVRHVLTRARRLLETAQGAAARFLRSVIAVLETALRERDAYEAGQRTTNDLADAALALACRLETLTAHPPADPAVARLARHLGKHLWNWFWFLLEPGLDATNHRAEQALRLGVVNRKVWGGNRDPSGQSDQKVLTSVIATCLRQGRSPIEFLSLTLTTWSPQLIPP